MIISKRFLILFCLWAMVQVFFLATKGIVLQFEAAKYIDQAHLLLNEGHFTAKNLWFYSFPIIILAIAIKTNIGFTTVYLLQVLLNGAATIVFYKLCRKLSSRGVAFIATILLILNLPLQEFNVYLQTESIYISGSIFFAYFVLTLRTLSFRNIFIIIVSLGLLSVTRPNGLMLIPATAVFLLLQFFNTKRKFLYALIFALSFIVFLFVINVALSSGGEWRFMLAYQMDMVLCAGTPYFHQVNVSDNPHSIAGFWYFITHNFTLFFRLAFLKSLAFFGLWRSYFSLSHNILLVLYFYPLFFLTAFSVRRWLKTSRNTFIYLSMNIALAWLVVILTCDDVHNRFFLVLSPYFYLLSLPMLQKLKTKLKASSELS